MASDSLEESRLAGFRGHVRKWQMGDYRFNSLVLQRFCTLSTSSQICPYLDLWSIPPKASGLRGDIQPHSRVPARTPSAYSRTGGALEGDPTTELGDNTCGVEKDHGRSTPVGYPMRERPCYLYHVIHIWVFVEFQKGHPILYHPRFFDTREIQALVCCIPTLYARGG